MKNNKIVNKNKTMIKSNRKNNLINKVIKITTNRMHQNN